METSVEKCSENSYLIDRVTLILLFIATGYVEYNGLLVSHGTQRHVLL
jgi:hypothetical protein